ncbi:MAG: hypothetical protein ACT4R6_04515 [Gemmatimonadaceae bacterium]
MTHHPDLHVWGFNFVGTIPAAWENPAFWRDATMLIGSAAAGPAGATDAPRMR